MSTVTFDPVVLTIHRLRVNVKSLAAESRIIRQEERRCGPLYRSDLHGHRVGRLREESRLAQLALAFVRRRPYRSVEAIGSKVVDPVTLANKINRVGGFTGRNQAELADWLK